MELATLEKDYWTLRSAEECHADNPDTFWIPDLKDRESLNVGDAAKLIFDIESQDEQGKLIIQGERIYVIVSQIIDDYYIGILDSQPASFEPSETAYLCFGAEIPFQAEHVIDINRPPDEYIEWQLGQEPERLWYRK